MSEVKKSKKEEVKSESSREVEMESLKDSTNESTIEAMLKSRDYAGLMVALIGKMTVIQLAEVEDALRSAFNVSEINMNVGASNDGESAADSNRQVKLVLEDLGNLSRIEALKLLNTVLKYSVSEAKEVLDNLPYVLMEDVTELVAKERIDEINASKPGLELLIK